MLTPTSLPALQRALAKARLDGWLLYDFQGTNPVASGILGLHGMVSRRVFALVPREGVPTAITHAIEQGPWRDWPAEWKRERYSTWRTLEGLLNALVAGKRIAMEYSPGDAVPYLDRIPAGVLEMIRDAGATVVSSGELVSRFFARWSEDEMASHERAAKVIADTGRAALALAGERARAGTPIHEHELQQWITERLEGAGLEFDHPAIVAAGPNAADPHYAPSAEHPRPIARGDVLLVDLWGREPNGIFADQTWMAVLGEPSPRAREVWAAVRDARDAAIDVLRTRDPSRSTVRGAEVDDAARRVIEERGLGEYFIHRTGHSIDVRSLHGAGPHIDNFETREERALVPGVGFSIEPGVYVRGEIGMRSEVNAYVTDDGIRITPDDYQTDLIVV